MYQDVFDDKKQTLMRNYFLNNLSKFGIVKRYKRNQIVDIDTCNSSFGIVIKGKVVKSIISAKGREKLLYTLRPGEIFGEMNYFGGGTLNYVVRVKEDAEISYISHEVLGEVIQRNAHVYQFIINSITRKFRIVLLQLTNTTFNDSIGRIADALIRLAACSDYSEADQENNMISTVFTQNELAHNIGCSRITVTRVLKKFAEENLIRIKNRKIVINDLDALASYTDRVQ